MKVDVIREVIVMYKSFTNSQSNYVECLWLGVSSMSSGGKVMSLVGRGFETSVKCFPAMGALCIPPSMQAISCLLSLHFLKHTVSFSIDYVVSASD